MSAGVRAGYKQTDVGVIPEDWEVLVLNKLFQLKQGVQCPIERQFTADAGGLRRFIRIVDLTNPSEGWRYIADPGSAHHIEKTDLFMVRYGSPGLVGFGYSGVVANNLFRLIPRKNIEGHFYYQYLAQRQDEIAGLSGSSTMPAVSFSTLNLLCVINPPLPEQRAIATALSDVDALLSGLDSLIAKKQNLKQAAMQQLLTGQTRLPGFSGEWEVKRLGDLLSYEQPTPYLVKSVEYANGNSVPVLTAGKTFILGYTNETDGVYSSPPVIIFDDFTTASKFVEFPFKAKSSAMKILKVREGVADIRFAFERMQIVDFQLGDHKRYWISEYSKLPIETPNLDEQTAIATVLSDMDTELAALQARRDKTRALKQGMMQELLTGRIRLV